MSDKDRILIRRDGRDLEIDGLEHMSFTIEAFLEKFQDAVDKAETDMISYRERNYDSPLPDYEFRVQVEPAGWDGGIDIFIIAYSLETDEEYVQRTSKIKKKEEQKLARKQKAAERAKAKAAKLAAEEKAQYEKLKAKYG